MADRNNEKPKSNATFIEGRGGGQGKPRTPSGKRKPWQPPQNQTTVADREKSAHVQATNSSDTTNPMWHPSPLSAESAKFGDWELSVIPIQNGIYWEWIATLPDREDENGKQFQGASFEGISQTKDDAKAAAKTKASITLLG